MCTPAILNREKIEEKFDISKFVCFCGDSFDKRPRLSEHQKRKKSVECLERVCDSCGKTLKSFNYFVTHTTKCTQSPNSMAEGKSPARWNRIQEEFQSMDKDCLERIRIMLNGPSNDATSTTVNILF